MKKKKQKNWSGNKKAKNMKLVSNKTMNKSNLS